MQVQSLHQEDPLEEKRHPTPVFLLGESYGQRSLADCSPWRLNEAGMTEHLSTQHNMSQSSIVVKFQRKHGCYRIDNGNGIDNGGAIDNVDGIDNGDGIGNVMAS